MFLLLFLMKKNVIKREINFTPKSIFPPNSEIIH
jgi:hypothetical protein